jgi:hypothetical protein
MEYEFLGYTALALSIVLSIFFKSYLSIALMMYISSWVVVKQILVYYDSFYHQPYTVIMVVSTIYTLLAIKCLRIKGMFSHWGLCIIAGYLSMTLFYEAPFYAPMKEYYGLFCGLAVLVLLIDGAIDGARRGLRRFNFGRSYINLRSIRVDNSDSNSSR